MNGRRPTVLVLDDEPDMLRALHRMLTRLGYDVRTESDPEQALERLRQAPTDVLLTDLRLPRISGLEVLRRARRIQPGLIVILITAYATIETAVEAIQEGANDYIPKPFTQELLQEKLERTLAIRFSRQRAEQLQDEISRDSGRGAFVGESPAFNEILDRIRLIAGADASILLLGESGTGKEMAARYIHALSPRRSGAFLPLDCSALSESLLESELFGYEKGAFTGADSARPGLFEYADGGTTFLDEIGNIPHNLQARLLRVLQEHGFRRVGGRTERHVDTRVIAATNADLQRAVQEGSFRQDLFYRLNCITLTLPPLRERREDISLLAHHFLFKHGRKGSIDPPELSPEALAALERHDWPGNVRELENAILQALAFRPAGTIRIEDLPRALCPRDPRVGEPEGETLEDVRRRIERSHILKVLEDTKWHRGQAAAILEISRKTLWEKMRSLGIQ